MTAGPAGPARPADSNPAPLLHRPQRIVLTGFMGAGKSTVGRMLAARLGWPFLDIDTRITQEHRLSVAEIFARQGEPHFRTLEAQAIAAALADEGPTVIALGGGAVETESVRAHLFQPDGPQDVASVPATVTIFLTAPLPELLARCSGGGETPVRPLLAAHAEKPEERLARRLPHYRRAHLTLDTSGISPAQVVDQLLNWLASRFPRESSL